MSHAPVTAEASNTPGRAPLALLRQHLLGVFARFTDDAQARRVFEVATQKVEYVAEMGAVRERHLEMRGNHVRNLERLLTQAQAEGSVAPTPTARSLALGLHALMDGLIQNWILQPQLFNLNEVGASAVDVYLAGLAPARQAPVCTQA